jgi:polysaccharide transporter, PST family
LLNAVWKERGRTLFRNRLVKNTVALMFMQVTSYIAPFLVQPYLSRVLSKEHYGLIAFAMSFNWYFMTLVEYGFNLTATRRIALHQDEPEKVSKIFSSVMAAKTFLTILGFVIMLSVVLVTPKLRPNLTLFCLCYLAVLGELLFPLWLFQGLQKMENLLWRDLLAKMTTLAMVFMFVHRDSDYLWAAGFQAGSMALSGVVGIITVPFLTPARFVLPSWEEAFTALKEGWPVFLSMAAIAIQSASNTFILGLRSGPVDVAVFSVANRLVIAVRTLTQPVVQAIYPHISHMAFGSRESAIAFLRKYTLILAAPFLLASVVLFAGAAPIIRIVFGAQYLDAVPLLRIMAFGVFLLALQHVYSTFYMLAFGYEKQWSKLILQGTAVNFGVLIPLLFLIWPPEAVSVTQLVLDIFVAVASYLFYRRTATTAPPVIAAQSVH